MSLTHGKDVNNNLVPLLLDPSGKVLIYGTLQVQLVAGAAVIGHVVVDTMPTTQVQSTQADKLFSYLSSFSASNAAIVVAAGSNVLTIYTVPANRIGVFSSVSFSYSGTITNVTVRVLARVSGVDAIVAYQATLVSGQTYCFPINVVLNAGDSLLIWILNATLNDTANNSTCGYLMHNT
jgi:hypothetical protein